MKVKDIENADLIIALVDGEFKIFDRSTHMLEEFDVKEVFTNVYGEKVVRLLNMKTEGKNA